MPFTPFHFGPSFLLAMLFRKKINLEAILIVSIILDPRTAYCFFTGCLPLHGPFHTLIGATLMSIPVIIGVYLARKPLSKILEVCKIKQDYWLTSIILGSLLGVWLHIFLDSFMHFDIVPLWPLRANPLLGVVEPGAIYLACAGSFTLGMIIYFFRLSQNH